MCRLFFHSNKNGDGCTAVNRSEQNLKTNRQKFGTAFIWVFRFTVARFDYKLAIFRQFISWMQINMWCRFV